MLFNDKLCNTNSLVLKPPELNIMDPFSFSTLHFLRTTYNRLITPTDIGPNYNVNLNKNFCTIPLPAIPPIDAIINKSKQCDPVLLRRNKINDISVNGGSYLNDDLRNIIISSQQMEKSQTNRAGCESLSECESITSSNETFSPNFLRRQRGEKRPIPEEQKDDKYFERRKRNNEAAKKSRDARKIREDRIALRAAVLEQENAILKSQIIALREELCTLRQIFCKKTN